MQTFWMSDFQKWKKKPAKIETFTIKFGLLKGIVTPQMIVTHSFSSKVGPAK